MKMPAAEDLPAVRDRRARRFSHSLDVGQKRPLETPLLLTLVHQSQSCSAVGVHQQEAAVLLHGRRYCGARPDRRRVRIRPPILPGKYRPFNQTSPPIDRSPPL